MRRGDNSQIDKAPEGVRYGLVNPKPAEVYQALEILPRVLRQALNEAGVAISPISIVRAYLDGAGLDYLLEAIRQGDEDMAVQHGTMPGEFWRGRPIQLSAPADKRTSAAAGADPRSRGRMGRQRPRRLPRGPGSY